MSKVKTLVFGGGSGRVFYQTLGHDLKACEHPVFQQMLVQGTLWAAGTEWSP